MKQYENTLLSETFKALVLLSSSWESDQINLHVKKNQNLWKIFSINLLRLLTVYVLCVICSVEPWTKGNSEIVSRYHGTLWPRGLPQFDEMHEVNFSQNGWRLQQSYSILHSILQTISKKRLSPRFKYFDIDILLIG